MEVDGQERKKSVLVQCFKSGVPANLEDAEGCVLYNHKVDRISGAGKTKSLLCMPQKDDQGAITAVLQCQLERSHYPVVAHIPLLAFC